MVKTFEEADGCRSHNEHFDSVRLKKENLYFAIIQTRPDINVCRFEHQHPLMKGTGQSSWRNLLHLLSNPGFIYSTPKIKPEMQRCDSNLIFFGNALSASGNTNTAAGVPSVQPKKSDPKGLGTRFFS